MPVANAMIFSCVASAISSVQVDWPSCMTMTRSLIQHFFKFARDHDDRNALFGQVVHEFVDFVLAPTSMPRVGSSMMSTLGLDISHLEMTTFC